jgi:glycosyltransferase involved in cell wall biosynthesis
MLPDKFSDEELIDALTTLRQQPEKRRRLGEKARDKILHSHSPQACAKQYAEAVEAFHSRREGQLPTLIQAISDANITAPDSAGLVALARALNINHPLPGLNTRIFLDISATVKNDRGTGIERVARAIIFTLLESAPPGYRIEPVYLSRIDGTWHHRYAAKYTLGLLNCPENILNDDAVDMHNGDILLTLDLAGEPLVQAQKAGLFADYRNRGVWVYATVFDLLPLQMPEVFPPGADRTHQTWLKAIAEFDGAVCISEAVSSDLQDWIDKHHTPGQTRRDFSIHSFHLGADVSASVPTRGLPDGAGHILKKIKARPGFLMVGTVEPRKGYTQVLEAFEHLWLKGIEVNLVIAGREGWKDLPAEMRRDIPAIVQRLRSHTQSGKRLFWLEDVSDEYLEKLYSASISLIAASYGEGFGLPLIEAAQHRLPVIARDIPVFREVAGEHACFFDTRDSAQLAESLLRWMDLYKQNRHPLSVDMPWQTWKKSALQLLDTITAGH